MDWKSKVFIITGQPGGGKSSVSKLLHQKGARIIDADQISRKCLQPDKETYLRVIAHFGERIIKDPNSKYIDRKALAKIILNNPTEKKILEEIIHPAVRDKAKQIASSFSKDEIIFYDCPLFFESGLLNKDFKAVIVIETDEKIAEKRFIERVKDKEIDKEFYKLLYQSQWPISKKVKLADYVIKNNLDFENLKQKVEDLWTYCLAI